MNATSFPNLPFAAANPPPNKSTTDIASIIAAGRAHGVLESAQRDSDYEARAEQVALVLQQAMVDRELAARIDEYDGYAKLARGQGNRAFVLGVAKGACVGVAVIVTFEILMKLARPS
jgi:hypothetical protein